MKKFELDFPVDDYELFLKAMNNNYKLLKKFRFENKDKLKPEQVSYSNEELKFKTIASNLTHKVLIDNNKFPDWDN